MEKDAVLIPTNSYQTPITQEFMDSMPQEVQDQFMDFVQHVPLIRWMIAPDRPHAKDLPRDKFGRIVTDITKPHILDNMDYFRPSAKFFMENGRYNLLKPNPNPNSEYGKWFFEEVRRCREGYVRESDGEWVTGYEYYYLNYSPIMLNREDEETGIFNRVEDFPDFWEAIHFRYNYWYESRMHHKHAMELARRGVSKSFSLASAMTHNLILGENSIAKKRVTTVLTAYTKEYLGDKDGTFSKFTPMLDFSAANTEFPRLLVKRSPSEMVWIAGHVDANRNITKDSSQNAVMGLSVKDDEGKIRGKRGVILFEEMGNYPNFKEVWNNVRDSVKEGSRVFAQMIAVGTSGDKESDFAGIRTMMYNPDSFEIYAVPNVYDLEGKETAKFCLFSPAYISRAGCMDKDGNSDVTKALKEILMERYIVKLSGDQATLMSRIAQMPITPAEAIMKVKSNFFPVTMINERLRQIDQDPRAFDKVYVGNLVWVGEKVEFRASDEVPIRDYNTNEDNTRQGALEIYEMPPKGDIPTNRYIIGHDPVDNDLAVSNSLPSTIVFDMVTDTIAAERTGRFPLADDNYDEVLKLCVFYNAKCLPEMNKKGIYSYFARKKAVWRLADCPEWLRQRGLVKYAPFGSAIKGVSVNAPINNTGAEFIKTWLMKTYSATYVEENGEVKTLQIQNVYRLLNRALLQEMVAYNPPITNTDRVSALIQVMLYREELLIKYGDSSVRAAQEEKDVSDDPFFDKDWNNVKQRLGLL